MPSDFKDWMHFRICWVSAERLLCACAVACCRVAIALRLDGIRNASEVHLVENAPAVGTAAAIMGRRALRGQVFFV